MAFATQTRKLYSDSVTLHFNPNSRNRYQLESGETPVGVTTVLARVLGKDLKGWAVSEVLKAIGGTLKYEKQQFVWYLDEPVTIDEEKLRWASKAYTRKSDKGKDVGSEVHEAIENFLKTNEFDFSQITPEAIKALRAFINWHDEVKPRVLATEQIVYSRSGSYAGTFDALLEIDGRVVLCDIKTSNASRAAPLGVYPENFLQLGAYSLAYAEAGGTHPKDLMVINASKIGKLSTLRASELGLSVRDCEVAWASVLKLYRFLEPLKKQIKEMGDE